MPPSLQLHPCLFCKQTGTYCLPPCKQCKDILGRVLLGLESRKLMCISYLPTHMQLLGPKQSMQDATSWQQRQPHNYAPFPCLDSPAIRRHGQIDSMITGGPPRISQYPSTSAMTLLVHRPPTVDATRGRATSTKHKFQLVLVTRPQMAGLPPSLHPMQQE